MVMNKKEILCNDSEARRAEICGEERRDSETRENGRRGGWECVGRGGGGGRTFRKAVTRTYCALMGWLSFLWPFFFAVEERY